MSSLHLLKPKAQLLDGTSAASLSQTWALVGAARSAWLLQTEACCLALWRWATVMWLLGSADSTWSRRSCRAGTGSARESEIATAGMLIVTERCDAAGTGRSIYRCWRRGGGGGRKIDPRICGRGRWSRSLSPASAPHTVRIHCFINRFLKWQWQNKPVLYCLIKYN